MGRGWPRVMVQAHQLGQDLTPDLNPKPCPLYVESPLASQGVLFDLPPQGLESVIPLLGPIAPLCFISFRSTDSPCLMESPSYIGSDFSMESPIYSSSKL